MSEPVRAVLRLDELPKVRLAGEGNFLYKVPFGDGHVVVKIYRGTRSAFLYLKKTFGNVCITGRTSHMPRARQRTETDCIRAWESHGFRCFRMHPEIEVEGVDRDLYMVFEFAPGRHFRDWFRDESVPLPERLQTWRKFIPEWHRRHRIAVETSDPRLIHENGDVKHVMLWEGGFLYFDFEMLYRSRNVRLLVGREILAYMRSVGRFFGPEMYERLMDLLVEHYPDKALLLAAFDVTWRHPNPFLRLARCLDRLKPGNRKRFSKYNVALDLRRRLDRASIAD
ncbi:MAG: hypothetical protein MUE73_00295 [Planctomycetes bacterium]|jgi:hypothetical protein|nr:hypothetical protein [Planctomycetota bacterium]